MARDFYYKPSGRFSPSFFLYVLLIVVVAAPVVSVVYIYLSYYLPIVYLNILVTIGCGTVMGLLMGLAAGLGKVRNPVLVIVSTIAVMCLAKYVQWTVYIPLVFSASYQVLGITFGERFLTSFYLLTEPATVFELAGIINDIGAWGVGRGGAAVSGVSLLVVWIMEFVAMTGVACMVSKEKPKFPFCEETKAWYGRIPNKVEAGIPENFEGMKTDIENGRYGELVRLAKTAQEDKNGGAHLLSLLFYKPPSCEQPYYLQINQLRLSGGKKKEGKILLKYIAVDGESAREIRGNP